MKKGKRVKPLFPIEYRLFLSPKYDERTKKHATYVALRTVTEFRNFHYEIIVEPKLTADALTLEIHGLRAPQLSIPSSGPAEFSTELKELNGSYDLTISKLGKEENSFTVDFSRDSIAVTKSPEKKFIEIVTNKSEW